jgi:hypothetical protein
MGLQASHMKNRAKTGGYFCRTKWSKQYCGGVEYPLFASSFSLQKVRVLSLIKSLIGLQTSRMKNRAKTEGIFAEQNDPSNIVEVSNTHYLRVHFHFIK